MQWIAHEIACGLNFEERVLNLTMQAIENLLSSKSEVGWSMYLVWLNIRHTFIQEKKINDENHVNTILRTGCDVFILQHLDRLSV